jgi:hypothetical protein
MDLTNSMNLSSMSKKIKILMPIVGAAVITLGTLGKAQALSFLSTSTGIGTIDTSTGIFTPFISSGPTFTDIALSNDDNLFGITFTELYSIDQSTGSSSLIGNLGRGGFNNALGFAFSDDNQLFGAGDSDFYTINTSTGATSLVANIPGFFSSGDIVFDPVNDRFLATSSLNNTTLFSISRNGTAIQIGNIGFSYVFGLFFENGTLFGYTGYGYGQQLTIDLTTGAGTFDKKVTGVTGEILGATSLPSTGPARPVPDTGSVLGLLTVGAFGAVSALKRKQRQKV